MDYTYDSVRFVFLSRPLPRRVLTPPLLLTPFLDKCMTSFSSGQATRMVAQVQTYRGL